MKWGQLHGDNCISIHAWRLKLVNLLLRITRYWTLPPNSWFQAGHFLLSLSWLDTTRQAHVPVGESWKGGLVYRWQLPSPRGNNSGIIHLSILSWWTRSKKKWGWGNTIRSCIEGKMGEKVTRGSPSRIWLQGLWFGLVWGGQYVASLPALFPLFFHRNFNSSNYPASLTTERVIHISL